MYVIGFSRNGNCWLSVNRTDALCAVQMQKFKPARELQKAVSIRSCAA